MDIFIDCYYFYLLLLFYKNNFATIIKIPKKSTWITYSNTLQDWWNICIHVYKKICKYWKINASYELTYSMFVLIRRHFCGKIIVTMPLINCEKFALSIKLKIQFSSKNILYLYKHIRVFPRHVELVRFFKNIV